MLLFFFLFPEKNQSTVFGFRSVLIVTQCGPRTKPGVSLCTVSRREALRTRSFWTVKKNIAYCLREKSLLAYRGPDRIEFSRRFSFSGRARSFVRASASDRVRAWKTRNDRERIQRGSRRPSPSSGGHRPRSRARQYIVLPSSFPRRGLTPLRAAPATSEEPSLPSYIRPRHGTM